MPRLSITFSLFPKLFCILFFLNFVSLKGNGYLKLVRYNYTYALQMAEKNYEKYFNTNKNQIQWKALEVPTYEKEHKYNIPQNHQKIMTYEIKNNGNGHPIKIYQNGNANFDMNDEILKQLIAGNFNNQRPQKHNFIDDKPKFIYPDVQKIPKKNNQIPQNQNNSGPSGKSWEDRTNKFALQYLNDFRASNGRSKLKWDENVFNVSVPHTKAMASKGQISHDGFDNRANQLNNYFFVYQSAENVAYFMTGEDVEESKVARKLTDQWINSPGHRRNMLLPDINHVGISIIKKVKNNGNYYYGTQFFVKK